jgi:hypothetical protein
MSQKRYRLMFFTENRDEGMKEAEVRASSPYEAVTLFLMRAGPTVRVWIARIDVLHR